MEHSLIAMRTYSKMYLLLLFITTAMADNIENFPFLAAIEYHAPKSEGLLCDGAVVSAQHILVQASCFPHSWNEDFRYHKVRVGKRDTPELNILGITVHESYDGTLSSPYNLALLKLEQPLSSDPVPMFNQDEAIEKGAKGETVAYGNDPHEDLHTTEVTIAECEVADESRVCSEKVDWFPTTCWFESGGPLVIDGRLAGIGTMLSDDKCVQSPFPLVFVQVPRFRKWIDEKLAN